MLSDSARACPRARTLPDMDPLDSVPVTVAATDLRGRPSWATLARRALPAELCKNLQQRLSAPPGAAVPHISYASDCSGADAPKHALADIIEDSWEAAQQESPNAVRALLSYLWASEAPGVDGACPKIMLTLNGRPQVLVSDMLRRTVTASGTVSAHDEYTQTTVTLTTPMVYTIGFECQDRSFCNTSSPKELDLVEGEDSGASTKTLHSSLRVITALEPPYVIIEHTFRKDTLIQLKAHLSRLKIYVFRLWVTSSWVWGLPMQRRRIFGVAINLMKCRLSTPMGQWTPILQRMAGAQARQPLSLVDCLLPAAHPAVIAEEKFHKRRPEPGRAALGGKGWHQCFKQHEAIRQRLRNEYPDRPAPSLADWLARFPTGSWIRHLPPREADVLCLHGHALTLVHGGRIAWETSGFCRDIGWSIGVAQKKHPGEQLHDLPSADPPALVPSSGEVSLGPGRAICPWLQTHSEVDGGLPWRRPRRSARPLEPGEPAPHPPPQGQEVACRHRSRGRRCLP